MMKLIIVIILHTLRLYALNIGGFFQKPSVHLRGSGCPECGKDNLNGKVWSHTEWAKQAHNSKSFDTFRVYVIQCFTKETNESFVKIGKTFTTVKRRFAGKVKYPFTYSIIKDYMFDNPKECCEFEKRLHNLFKEHRYNPLKSFVGRTECFTLDILPMVLNE